MAELSERHEIRVHGKDHTIVFTADSSDGRPVIRQESNGKRPKDVCTITISDPEELRDFFEGLRRILSSLGHEPKSGDGRAGVRKPRELDGKSEEERQAAIAQARQKNPQAIARAHKRSPRAIELRLQRLGLLPEDETVGRRR